MEVREGPADRRIGNAQPQAMTSLEDRPGRISHGKYGGSGRARHRRCPRDRAGDQHQARRPRRPGGRGYSRGADTAKQFAAAHEGSTIHQGNIGVAADCQRVISEVLEHGQLDILVNNAGITIDRTVRKMSPEDWDRVVHVNLSGAFYLSHAVLQHMLDRGYGRIINISSVIGEKGNIGQANYAAAKSGLFGLTNSLALETARKGITVNSVAPGSSPPRWSRPCPRRC